MSVTLDDLPDEVRSLIEPEITETPDTLAQIGVELARKRDDAKAARTSSSIEETWKQCEEAYIGIDDANRHEMSDAAWHKPMTPSGPVTTGRAPRETDHKSTLFVRLTARYVDAGSAKMGEILLPPDDKAFSFTEMPVPELIKAKDDYRHVVHEQAGPLFRPAQPGEAPPPGAPGPTQGVLPAGLTAPPQPASGPPQGTLPGMAPPPSPQAMQPPPGHVPLTVRDLALEKIELARKQARAAETRIYDWMIDCRYRAEMRKVIDDAARIGVGVLKGPVPKTKKRMVVERTPDGIEVRIKETIKPVVTWVDPWNVYPDPACGENIHDGAYLFERDYLSERQVERLKGEPGYIGPQIDKVLKEGPNKANEDDDRGSASTASRDKAARFEVWYYYGTLKPEEVRAISEAAGKNVPADDDKSIYVIATLINDTVIKATINPLNSGEFPYHSIPWQRREKHWAGIGIAEQVQTPQKMINGATRAMMNNAGKSAGSIIVVDQDSIVPADGEWTLTPDKLFYRKSGSMVGDIGQAFKIFEIPNQTDPLMKIVEYALQLAEESTSIPLITQGQSGETQPETVGGMNIQNNNANQLLRDIGYSFDDYITEPVVNQFYEWLLLDEDVPEEEKGEYTIDAHGSVALVERAIQDQSIAQMGQMVANPIYGIDPKKWAKLFLKSKRLDPDDVQYTEEEQQRMAQQPPPEAPQVTAAKINADTQLKLGIMKQQADQQSLQSEERIEQAANELEGARVQNETARVASEHQAVQVSATVDLHKIVMEQQTALNNVKAELAKVTMQLQTERELNAADNAAQIHGHRARAAQQRQRPPVQTPGRAGNGRAFEQGPPQ